MYHDYQSAKVRLFPEGKWYDSSLEESTGDVMLIFIVKSNRFLYLKEGAIVPPDGSGVKMGRRLTRSDDWYGSQVPN